MCSLSLLSLDPKDPKDSTDPKDLPTVRPLVYQPHKAVWTEEQSVRVAPMTTCTDTTLRLVEDPSLAWTAPTLPLGSAFFENRIIFGDNLPVLKALSEEYANSIQCIYLDPPYNTGNAIPLYPDGSDHHQWLEALKPRLELLWALLRDDGFLAIQIDDNEFARLYLLLADMMGEQNLKTICVKMAEPTGFKMVHVITQGSLPRLKEYIILVGKSGIRNLHPERIAKASWDPEYRWVVGQTSRQAIRRSKRFWPIRTELQTICSRPMQSVGPSPWNP